MRHVGQRLLQVVPTLVGALVLVFFLMRVLPGDPAAAMLGTNATPQAAYRAAYAVMSRHKDSFVAPYWRVIDAREPAPGRREGRIEAIAYSSVMGFRDDVVVRIRPDPDGARVDIRSSSRYGRHDFGTNASRIASLSEAIDDAIDSLKPEKTPDDVKKAKKV